MMLVQQELPMKNYVLTTLLLSSIGLTTIPAIAQTAVKPMSTPAAAATAAEKIPELKEGELEKWVEKLNTYTSLFNRSSRGVDSWKRYTSWVDLKTGPTGKERVIYGLYSLYDDTAASYAPKAIAAASAEPEMKALDATVIAFAASVQTLHPLVTEASNYYSRKDYTDDDFAKGKELHPKLVAAFKDYIARREIFDDQLTSLKKQVDVQFLAQIEKTEGRKYRWHAKRTVLEAQKTLEVLTVTQSKKDLPAFAEAVKKYAEVVHEFDEYIAKANDLKGRSLNDQPGSLLAKFRDAREALEKGQERSFVNHANGAISKYNMMIQFNRI